MKEQLVRSNAISARAEQVTDLLMLSYEPILVWRLDGGIERWGRAALWI
jgi:hypothetical protein